MIIACFAAKKEKSPLEAYEYPPGELGEHDVEVSISHCGICHSDIHLIDNDWKVSQYPLVPGHEIIGNITAVGSRVHDHKIGDRVGIGWQRSSCFQCALCGTGEENLCFSQKATCVGYHGGFAKKIITDGRFAFHIPKELSSEGAAPLLCGGATVYSPFITHNIKPTSNVGIIGIGGLGHLAIKFASAFGCEVTALSHTPDKKEEALRLGAHHFLSSTDKNLFVNSANRFDFLLCTISAPLNWEEYLSLLSPKGILCFVGAQSEPISLPVFPLIVGRKTICGSNIAGRHDLKNMLELCGRRHIEAEVEVFPLAKVNDALEKVRSGKVRYRAVLDCR